MKIKIAKETWSPVYVTTVSGAELDVDALTARRWVEARIAFDKSQREMAAAVRNQALQRPAT